jgi:peroxiredoxin
MLQAEIGSAKPTPAQSYPTRGHLLPDFTLPSTDSKQISPYDYRGHSNLIAIFAGNLSQTPDQTILSELARHYFEIREQNAQVLLILACSHEKARSIHRRKKFPFAVVADEDIRAHRLAGALDAQDMPATALYVTDRFLEVFAAWRTALGDGLRSASEVISWLEYIESQCPECTQAEWPADDVEQH